MATMRTLVKRHVYGALAGVEPLPADRPVDHLHRILLAFVTCGLLGALTAALTFSCLLHELSVPLALLLLVLAVVIDLVLVQWWGNYYLRRAGAVPAVARVLPTSIPSDQRTIRRLGRPLVLEPVVVHPTDGSPDFRAACFIKAVGGKNPWTGGPGTLVLVDVLKSGFGLAPPRVVTEEQKRLHKDPDSVPQDAPALPIRQMPWTRDSRRTSLEYWLSSIVAAVGSLAVMAMAFLGG